VRGTKRGFRAPDPTEPESVLFSYTLLAEVLTEDIISPREIATWNAFKVLTEDIISRGAFVPDVLWYRERLARGDQRLVRMKIYISSRPLKKAHVPPACPKQAFRIVALDRCGKHSGSKRSRSNVLLQYVSARRFLARRSAELGRSLSPGTFLTGL